LPPGSERELIAPSHEDAARAAVGQRRKWEISEFLFNDIDLFDVVGARALGAAEKFAAYLISL
jgi:hypothetical protein